MEGKVLVGDTPATKAGTLVDEACTLRLRGEDIPYVSRGGLKLAHALDHFGLDVRGKVALDAGASTGGFTDVLLQRGAARVYAVDVGYGQLAWKLRTDPRVVCIERENIRTMPKERIPEAIDLAVCDLSFISLTLVLDKFAELLGGGSVSKPLVALIKPQFEVGREGVGKGGVVRDPVLREQAVQKVLACARDRGWRDAGVTKSPILGPKGNEEFLALLWAPL